MNNLLIITQKVDEGDDLLGFFVDWIREFAIKFDKVFVITLAKGTYDLPSNVEVFSLGKERGSSKLIRLIAFYRLLFTLVPKSSGVFAHMSPVFVVASWPIAFVFRKKIILWYLHRSVTLRLKIAEILSYKIVTAAKESLKFQSEKIVETGHGININKFRTQRNWTRDDKLRILSVGRISKIKNYETLLEAAKVLRDKSVDFDIKIIGKPVMSKDGEYLKSLQLKIISYQLENMFNLVGFVPHDKIVEYYKNSDIVVGLTPDGGIDKTILEGMASGCLTLTSNRVCKKYFGEYSDKLIFNYQSPESLAEKVIYLNQLSSENKKEISEFLLDSVVQHHQLKNVVNKVSSLL